MTLPTSSSADGVPDTLKTVAGITWRLLVLIAGIFNMFLGGEGAPERSQKLMRWRVGLQFVALAVALTALYLRGR